MSFLIGPHTISARALAAPMAGISDYPYRTIAKEWGAALTYGEMLTAQTSLWNSKKSQGRLPKQNETGISAVQIAGYDPKMLADAARQCEAMGAQIIDINMGCPAKKVCNRAAGSALLQDLPLVQAILESVVQAVDVPVTLKTRTGWSKAQKNGVEVAKIAEASGIQALTVHGRTREDRFKGQAEYETITDIVRAVRIPVIANGDIRSAEHAHSVLQQTGATAVMIGRGAQGQPWLFRDINHYLNSREQLPAPSLSQQAQCATQHLALIHAEYAGIQGVRIARKHIAWYTAPLDHTQAFRKLFNGIDDAHQQHQALEQFYTQCNKSTRANNQHAA